MASLFSVRKVFEPGRMYCAIEYGWSVFRILPALTDITSPARCQSTELEMKSTSVSEFRNIFGQLDIHCLCLIPSRTDGSYLS